LRHLLTHSSGFVYDMWNADMVRYLEVTGKAGIISCTNAALDLPLVFDPGTAWDYGNRHRLGRQGRGGRQRKTLGVWLAENLFARLHARHGFRIPRRSARAPARFMPARRRGSSPRPGNSPVAGIRNGGGGLLRHGIGLSSFRSHDSERRRASTARVCWPSRPSRLMSGNAMVIYVAGR